MMGVKNLICVRNNGKWVVAQRSNWDGFPTGQGLILFKFLRDEENVARLRAGLAHTFEATNDLFDEMDQVIISERRRLERQDPADLYDYITSRRQFLRSLPRGPIGESTTRSYLDSFDLATELFPSLSRNTGAKILDIIANADAQHKVPVKMDLEFAGDSFNCEWAYIVDLDEERLKIFGGRDITDENHPFNEQFNTLGDWLDVPKLLLTFTFAELRGWDEEEYRRCMRGYH